MVLVGLAYPSALCDRIRGKESEFVSVLHLHVFNSKYMSVHMHIHLYKYVYTHV